MDTIIKILPIIILLLCLVLGMGGFEKSHKRMGDEW